MLISISFAYTVFFFPSVPSFLFHYSSLFCVFFFPFFLSFFLYGRVSFHWSSYHTFICTTLSAGGGEPGLLGN